jgi:hypothetical protein
MAGPTQLYCGTRLKLKDGVCKSWGEATSKDSPACAEYEGESKPMNEPNGQINELQSLRGFGVAEEMPGQTALSEFDLNKIPGVKEAQETTWQALCDDIRKDPTDQRIRRQTTTVTVHPDTLKTEVTVKFEPPKLKPVKIDCPDIYGVRENGVIKFEETKQEPLFPKG